MNSLCCEGVCPHDSCLLSVIRGFRNGVVYGARVRFPHALVMTLMFKSGSPASKIRAILRATTTHAKNLGSYVALYKTVLCLMRHISKRNSSWNHAIAGAVGGVTVFGSSSAINSQINMYVFSRVAVGLSRYLSERGLIPTPTNAYRMFAALCWVGVMVLFEKDSTSLQGSLVSSMEYLYHDSDKWPMSASNPFQWFIMGSDQ